MTEVFKPRENMVFETRLSLWVCRDKNGKLVCDGGPSVIWNGGSWSFYKLDVGPHRLDGPALSNGEWYIRGKRVTEEIHAFAEENSIDLDNLSDENKVMIALRFS